MSLFYPTQEDINCIGRITGLKELRLHSVGADIDLSVLANLQQLKIIDFQGTEVDYTFLKKLGNLEEIYIFGEIGDLSYFQQMKKLKKLSVTFLELADFQYLEGLTGLEELRLPHCYERKNYEALKNLSNLSVFEIHNVIQEDIGWIGKMEELKELTLYGCLTELDLTDIGKLAQLKKLSIGHTGNIELNLSPLAGLKQLEEIELYALLDTDCSFLRQLANLKKAALYSTGVEDLSYFQNMTNLEELVITSAGKVDFSYLEGLSRLRRLKIGFSELAEGSGENIRVLGKLKYLSELRLECYWMLEEPIDCSFLYGLTGLEGLEIKDIAVKSMEPFSGLSSLRWLHLSNIDSDAGYIDMECIGKIKSLQSLTIEYMEAESVQPLSELPFLADLRLYYTDIQDIEALKNLQSLNSLRIEGNTSEQVKEQAKLYFSHVENVEIKE